MIAIYTPWHFLYFLPLPQGQGSLRPTLPTNTFSLDRPRSFFSDTTLEDSAAIRASGPSPRPSTGC